MIALLRSSFIYGCVLLAILSAISPSAAAPAPAGPAPAGPAPAGQAPAGQAAAQEGPGVAIRQGRHGNMGRLVFDFPAAEHYSSQQQGNVLTIVFTPARPIAAIALHIPGVAALQGGAGMARLQLLPNATPVIYRLGDRVVVDVRLTNPGRRGATPPQRSPAQAGAPLQQEAGPAAVKRHLAAAPVTPISGNPAPQLAKPAAPEPASAEVGPPSLAAPTQPPAAPPEVIDFATQPGAAAFRRGDQAILVFDTSEIPDLTGLQSSPLFAAANLVSLQDAQVITLPLPAADSLALTPVAGGWQVAAVAAAPPVQAPPQTAIATVEFPMQSANQSIIIQDPLTGGDLLVGTVTQAGDAADFAESGPGYAVLPAWLGVVIVPQADNLGLNASLKGFELVSDAANGLPLGAKPPVSTAALPAGTSAGEAGQTIDLPHGETADLWKQLIADQRAAAILPPLGRLGAQITLARDMLALGLGPEAIGVLDTAILENPAAQENGQIAGMRAIAGVISHRSRASDFTAAGLVPGTELSFWHAAAGLDSGQTTQAMPGLLGGLPLFETYPATLRHTIEAPLAEALADNGNLPAAKQLVQSDPGNPMLDLARAKILDRQGNAKAALAAYQKLAGSQDDRVSALAGARAVELRLAAGQLNDAQAADALDAQLFDWRAPEHERHMRMRIAQLRAAAGQWPQAFTMLAAARRLFPAYDAQIDAERAGMFLKMLAGNNLRQLSPIETVAVLQQNEDLIPSGGDAAPVLSLLAQRLDALDLPGAAAPMLNRLIQRLPASAPRASLGASLAQVDLDAGSPVAALSDLSQTQADNLPPDLTAQRNVLAAKAQAAAGNAVAAINTLAPAATSPGSIPGLDAQAQIAEQSGQWPQAEQALGTLVSRSIPPAGPLDSSQENLLLRLATAASHSNDNATLTSLASQYGSRVGADAAGQMFQTLTAPPLTGDQGLNQALHEIAQLQALPNMVNAVAAPPAKAVASGRATPP